MRLVWFVDRMVNPMQVTTVQEDGPNIVVRFSDGTSMRVQGTLGAVCQFFTEGKAWR